MGSYQFQRAVAVLMILGGLAGCSKDDLGKLADKAKGALEDGKEFYEEKTKSAADSMGDAKAKMQEQLNMAGSIQIKAGGDFNTKACYASLVQQGSGRPAVFQLRSYRDEGSEEFPSIFLQAQVPAASAEELKAAPIEARLFVQEERDGKVLFSAMDKPVQLKITAVDEKSLKAELVSASLFDTARGEAVPATGQFEFTLPTAAVQ